MAVKKKLPQEYTDRFKFEGMISAARIFGDPDLSLTILGNYCILYEISSGTNCNKDLIPAAINAMAERGWRCINITAGKRRIASEEDRIKIAKKEGIDPLLVECYDDYVYALMERLDTKKELAS